MSDEGGGGSGKGGGGSDKGGGSNAGFTPTPSATAGGATLGDQIASGRTSGTIPLLAVRFLPGRILPGVEFGSSPKFSSTASIGSPEGITSAPAAGPSAAAVSAPSGVGGNPTDLTTDLSARGNIPLPQPRPAAAAGGDVSLDNLAATGNVGGTVPSAPTSLSPEQLGAPQASAGSKPAAAASGSSGEKSVLESLGIKNPVGAAIGAAGLGYSVLSGQQSQKYSPELLEQARSLNAQGQQLLSYLQSGNLPPGLKASLDQATSAAKAKIISNFASQGLNTDPTQNTALAAQLAQVDQQALISTAQIGQQLLQSGIAETGLSSDLYKTLANIDQTQTANIGKAIANFASAISGSGGGINLKVA